MGGDAVKKLEDILQQGLAEMNQPLSASVEQSLLDYLSLLLKWNAAYNLTAVRDPEEMVVRHILDSVVIGPYLHGRHIIDVGTGAGLPGIPLALCYPEHRFTLLDSNGKKIRFLLQAQQVLPLSNVVVVNHRVETFQPEICFDSVVSRAFASLTDMLKLTKHLICANGKFLAMKASYPAEEIAAIPQEFAVSSVHPLNVPLLNKERHLICLMRKGD
jgi:16S rRNA (guanine527-N7)-methyltransferase